MNFSLKTFGCKTNQYETQVLRERLLAAGHHETIATIADFLIINTCAVTGRADSAWRNFLHSAQRANSQLRVIVTGCAATIDADLAHKIKVEKIFTNAEKELLANYFSPAAPTPDTLKLPPVIHNFSGHSRAFVKIQDGCDNTCAYCLIPRARGAGRSRPAAEIIREVENLAARAYQEIALTGINIGAYRDGDFTLAKISERLTRISGVTRIRLGSIEPPAVDENLLLTIRDCPKICRHLHLPLQSGDDRILQLMNRRYDLAAYFAALDRARKILDQPAITTDLMIGVPTEDEAVYQNTRRALQRAEFSRVHLFLYSPRPQTPLANLPRRNFQLANNFKHEIREFVEQTAERFAQSLIGKTESLLVEKATPTSATGYGERYLRITVKQKLPTRQTVRVRITATAKTDLQAEIISD